MVANPTAAIGLELYTAFADDFLCSGLLGHTVLCRKLQTDRLTKQLHLVTIAR